MRVSSAAAWLALNSQPGRLSCSKRGRHTHTRVC